MAKRIGASSAVLVALAAVSGITSLGVATVALGQQADSLCRMEPADGTGRQVLRCPDGLSLTAEAGAEFTVADRDGDGRADAAALEARALLIDVAEPLGGGGFEVTTPQAIAAVRGTVWAVDVAGAKTSVFVVSGQVAVRRVAGEDTALLGAGEGVDVEAGDGPLTVRRWPAARVAALLDRLGR